jgi:hypothetical protein
MQRTRTLLLTSLLSFSAMVPCLGDAKQTPARAATALSQV